MVMSALRPWMSLCHKENLLLKIYYQTTRTQALATILGPTPELVWNIEPTLSKFPATLNTSQTFCISMTSLSSTPCSVLKKVSKHGHRKVDASGNSRVLEVTFTSTMNLQNSTNFHAKKKKKFTNYIIYCNHNCYNNGPVCFRWRTTATVWRWWRRLVPPSPEALISCRQTSVSIHSHHHHLHVLACQIFVLFSAKSFPLKSDFNEVLFVLESGELLCKNIKITTICILKKGSTHKKIFKW